MIAWEIEDQDVVMVVAALRQAEINAEKIGDLHEDLRADRLDFQRLADELTLKVMAR